MDREVDIRPYVVVVGRRWRMILACAMLSGIIALSIALLLPKQYTATASVFLFIQTSHSSIGQGTQAINIETIDSQARRYGLVSLVRTDSIEAQLPQNVAQEVGGPLYRPGLFLHKEQIASWADGDIIRISAKASTAKHAQLLAEAWATTYLNYVTKAYANQQVVAQFAGAPLEPLEPTAPDILWITTLGVVIGAAIAVLAALALAHVQPNAPGAFKRVLGSKLART